jgi:hypothetical protein
MNDKAIRLQKGPVLLLFLAAMPSGRATTLQWMSLDQLARAADTVVRARCVATSARWGNDAIWTFIQFQVVETLKGNPPQRIRVRLPGGRVGPISMRVEAVPHFQRGDDAVLFLEKSPTGDYGVTAWTEGTFRIRRYSRNGAEFVTQDSSAVAVFNPATRQFHNGGIRNVPWNEFRRRLAGALLQLDYGGAQ